jgi:hypothetical protein
MKNRGHITITVGYDITHAIEMQSVENNLWLCKNSIARLFNCFPQKNEMNLRSIYKNQLLRENDISYTYRYTDKGIEKQIIYYNLEALIF